MKQIYTFTVAFLMMGALAITFTSCGEDHYYWDYYDDYYGGDDYNDVPSDGDEDFFVAMAQTLAGQWRGSMRAYEIDENGNAIDSIDFETDIEFKQYNSQSVSGTGTQWDFAPGTDSLEYQRDFTWLIDTTNGNIVITYKEVTGENTYNTYTMTINYDDLNLNDRTFTGWLYSEDGGEADDFYFDRYSESRAGSTRAGKANDSNRTKVVRLKVVMR
ncbi:MAG: hypothetical protein ACOYJF_04015 [Prevotella sp.]|jgi:hypothetical protein